MFKRKMFFMFLFVLFMAFIAGTFVVIGKNKLPETKVFDVGDYQYYILSLIHISEPTRP